MTDNEILKIIEENIDTTLLGSSKLVLVENLGIYNSVMIHSPSTPYRGNTNATKNVLYCRIKNNGKVRYISFSSKWKTDFESLGFITTAINSEPDFVRLDINEFLEKIILLRKLLNTIFTNSFSFPPFGCCALYKECSNAEKCLHEDLLYATACMYRKHLESGNNFYKDVI